MARTRVILICTIVAFESVGFEGTIEEEASPVAPAFVGLDGRELASDC